MIFFYLIGICPSKRVEGKAWKARKRKQVSSCTLKELLASKENKNQVGGTCSTLEARKKEI